MNIKEALFYKTFAFIEIPETSHLDDGFCSQLVRFVLKFVSFHYYLVADILSEICGIYFSYFFIFLNTYYN